ncbi:MAG: deoxyribodipyrimidine photo-lyase [Candidatus Marinimicrobia bacterium]|nr:deoxyribodipyrimidine photo-lyase [Candidatus Neomarinimicrobiota bacterium]
MRINNKRIHKINEQPIRSGSIVYWMSRDQRVDDNWALLYAEELALNRDLFVVFNLVPTFSQATLRQYSFMLEGLKEVAEVLKQNNIPFHIYTGDPAENIPEFIEEVNCGALVTDFDPLKIKRKWQNEVKRKIDIAFYEVDTHNIVPCRESSQKQEYAAYTIRPKINNLLPEFLEEFPEIEKQKKVHIPEIDWESLYEQLEVDYTVKPIDWLTPGSTAAYKNLQEFIETKIEKYPEQSNDPNQYAISNMSPYLHFGQISAQRIALEIEKADVSKEAREAYLEQLIIRKELTDNYCFYNKDYDSPAGFPDWAKKTIKEHRNDEREHVYTLKEFENAETHDRLWNAAQKEMLKTGKMHNYMRMYWAKKILEWTNSAEEAFDIALYLNDKYELDGRDPNGYGGVAWSVGGVHDRAWKERDIFGKIRYMSYSGCERKFDVDEYVARFL